MAKIIAETCQNHNGDKKILEQMIIDAAKSGADYVKGQIIFSEDLVHRPRFEEGHIEDNGIIKAIKRQYDLEKERLSKLDLTEDDHKWFIEKCVENNIKPLTTIFTRKRIDFVAGLPWPEKIIKVASPDIISHPFLEELCDAFEHLIISTGGATDEEIESAVNVIKKKGNKFTLLHCVSLYPNTLDICNLARINFLRKFTNSVGWSDHTFVEKDKIIASMTAVYLGVDFIERHFTVLPSDQTKDGPISITPELLKELADFIKLSKDEQKNILDKMGVNLEKIIGSETRELTHKERLNMDYFRGRFASHANGEWIYNWENKPVK